MYKTIYDAYKCGYYTLDNVKLMVEVNFITPEEYKQITDQEYVA